MDKNFEDFFEFGKLKLFDYQAINVYLNYVAFKYEYMSGGLNLHVHGGGNTVIAACFASLVAAENKRVLVVASNPFVIENWKRELDRIDPSLINIISHGRFDENGGKVIVGTAKSIVSSRFNKKNFNVLIIDGALHVAAETIKRIIKNVDHQFLLGLSANQYRTDGQHIIPLFNDTIFGSSNYLSLIRQARLSDLSGFRLPTKITQKHGVYIDEKSGKELSSREAIDLKNSRIVENYKEKGKNLPAIAFCKTVNQAEKLAAAFNQAEIPAAAVHSKLSQSKINKLIRDFNNNKIKILTNKLMLTEGFSSKAKCCILARPFSGRTAHVQMPLIISRIMTPPHKGMVLDFVDNIIGQPTQNPQKPSVKWEKFMFDFGDDDSNNIGTDEKLDTVIKSEVEGNISLDITNEKNQNSTTTSAPNFALNTNLQYTEKFDFAAWIEKLSVLNIPAGKSFFLPFYADRFMLATFVITKTKDSFVARKIEDPDEVFASGNTVKTLFNGIKYKVGIETVTGLGNDGEIASTELMQKFASVTGLDVMHFNPRLTESYVKNAILDEVLKQNSLIYKTYDY